MAGRIGYHAMQFYYYDRTYSPVHLPNVLDAQAASKAGVFYSVYKFAEQQAMCSKDEDTVVIDRAFEFSDYQEYRTARLWWEREIGSGRSGE